MMRTLILLPALLIAACAGTPADKPSGKWKTLSGAQPLVIAHRGASGLRPEHTIVGYKLALEQGADCIEPDLVVTKDGVLVDRHDTFLSTTTDVADHPEFASRKRLSPDPEFTDRTDWWVIDFTLAELKTLRAKQSFKGRSPEFDKQFDVPTFAEVLKLARESKTKSGKAVCVYPEAKSPAYHQKMGFEMLAPILADLRAAKMDQPGSPVFIQSFEPPFVKRAFDRTHGLNIVLLVASRADYDKALASDGAPYWDGVGPTVQMLFNADGTSSGLIEGAHARDIVVHPWTFRDDAPYRDPPFNSEPAAASMQRAIALGVDGFFTDFPATGVKAVSDAAK